MVQPRDAARSRLPLVASWVVVFVLLVQESLTGIMNPDSGSWLPQVLGTLCALGASAVFVRWQYLVVRGVPPASTVRLVALMSLGAAIAVVVDGLWAPVPMALSAVMLSLRPWRAAAAIGVMLLALLAFGWRFWSPVTALGVTTGVLAIAAVLHAFTSLSIVIRELQLAREEVARTRVDQERLRIQRDLHDMLGRTLVAASLRNQIALRALGDEPGMGSAREQLMQLHSVVTDGQARLRAITSGPVIASLTDEIASATSLCSRIGISVTVDTVDLPTSSAEKFLGAVVRESITNMLKHSQASSCTLTIKLEPMSVVASIVNDGCARRHAGGAGDGTGLAHLRDQCAALGGSLTAEHLDGGRFRVTARLPRPTELEAAP